MDVPGPWAPSSRLRRRTRRGPTQPPCASGMPPHGRTRCARHRRRRSWEAALPSMGYRTGRRNAHVIREGHVIRGRCHRNGVSRGSPRRPAARRLPCVRTQPFPTSRGVASAQERPARARALACRPSRRRDGRRPAAVQGRSDPVAGQLAQHRELRAARLELGDDSRDEHDRATVNRRAGGRVLRAGSAEPTKRADRVRIVPRVRGTLIEAAPAAAPTAPHSPSPTRSSSPSGACCRPARSSSTPAATTTPAATRPHHPTARRQARAPRYSVTPQEAQGTTWTRSSPHRRRAATHRFVQAGGVAGSNPGVAALQAALVAVAPKRFHARGEPVARRGIEPKRVPRFSEAGAVAQAERLDHGSTGNGCGLVPCHWITDSRCPRWSPVMGSSENAPKKVVVSSRRAA